MNHDTCDVDLLSVALVREYLSRKGYKSTLNQFDNESKKRDTSIQNRKVLAKELGIMDLVKKNKERGMEALKSFLEMIVYDFIFQKDISNKTSPSCSQSSPSQLMSAGKIKLRSSVEHSPTRNKTMSCLKTSRKDFIDLDFIPAANVNDIALNTSPNRLANLSLGNEHMNSSPAALSAGRKKLVHNMMEDSHGTMTREYLKKGSLKDGVSNSTSKSESNQSPSNLETIKNNKMDSSMKQSSGTKGDTKNDNAQKTNTSIEKINISNKPCNKSKITKYLTMCEIENENENENDLGVTNNYEDELIFQSEGISLDTAIKLKVLVLGSARRFFNTEWTQQGFTFCQHPLLKYGLVQEKGGTCGLLASVQATVLKHLLFVSADQNLSQQILPQPTPKQQKIALVNALVNILELISQNQSVNQNSDVVVVLPSHSLKFTPSREYKNDNLTEKLQLFYLSGREVKTFILKNILYFMNTNGCILFLYSAVLTYGIENIRNTMDEANGTLMGSHGYCTQEMVNILLTGKAVSNVFDGDVELDSGGEDTLLLCGIKTRNDIGFLSLFEYYHSCKVGDNYKNPNYPIWVVCSESHFSVLFSPVHLDNEEKTSFDLYYYDGLGRQDEEIRLTVTIKKSKKILSSSVKELIPPLEHCIQTKWSSAIVSWNGSEPIL